MEYNAIIVILKFKIKRTLYYIIKRWIRGVIKNYVDFCHIFNIVCFTILKIILPYKVNFPLCNCSILYRYEIRLRNSSLSKCTYNDIAEQSDDVNDVKFEFSIHQSISFDYTIRKTHTFFSLFALKSSICIS